MTPVEIAVAIPGYDAEPTIAEVVRRASTHGFPVLVVDDGSSDRTAARAEEAGARVLRHAANLGKGRALETALSDLFARGFDAVVTLDADGQHPPEEIPRLVEAYRTGADLVLGTRAHLFPKMSAVRRTSNTISSRLISILAGTDLRDAQTGFRVYGRDLFGSVGLPEPRFEAESAVLVRAARMGFRIEFVPVRLDVVDGTPTSHYRPIVDSLRIAGAVIRARMERRTWAHQRSW